MRTPASTLAWIALGLAIGWALPHKPAQHELTGWPDCLKAFGHRIARENVTPDDEEGVSVRITSETGEWMSWSLTPEEAEQMATYLLDSAETTERADHSDGGTEL